MSELFEKTEIKGMELKNRLVRSATHEGMADENGFPTEDLFKLYERLGKGGVGLIITGLTYVSRDGKIDALVSAGNTGAVVTSALLSLGRIPGIHRARLRRQTHVDVAAEAEVRAGAANALQAAAAVGVLVAGGGCRVVTPTTQLFSVSENDTEQLFKLIHGDWRRNIEVSVLNYLSSQSTIFIGLIRLWVILDTCHTTDFCTLYSIVTWYEVDHGSTQFGCQGFDQFVFTVCFARVTDQTGQPNAA